MPDSTKTHTLPETRTATDLEVEGRWKVVVLNDPVNLMSYVVLVFKKVFGFDEAIARKHMLEVHEQGRSVVWTGMRERAEHHAFTLQKWHLTAVLEPDERIEVKLSLPVVAPLLDVIKSTGDTLASNLAAPNTLAEIENDLRGAWKDDLIQSQNEEVKQLLALFDAEFFSSGVVAFDGVNAEPIIRACAAVRLRLRERFLADLNEELLESGDIELEALPEASQKAFMCYLFLATIQELIIQHLDSSILEG